MKKRVVSLLFMYLCSVKEDASEEMYIVSDYSLKIDLMTVSENKISSL